VLINQKHHSILINENSLLNLQKEHINKVLKTTLKEIDDMKESEIVKEKKLKTMFERLI
jgi:regulator of replication initiation timing